MFYSFCSSLLCQLPCRTDLCWGRKLNNLHVLFKNCNINRSLVMKIIFWLSIPLWLPNMCSCWFSVYSILTLLKKFQFNMSDTEVGICQCLYFKTQISLFKTRPKKKCYSWNVNDVFVRSGWPVRILRSLMWTEKYQPGEVKKGRGQIVSTCLPHF